MISRLHVVGAGLSGLAAAVHGVSQSAAVTLYEGSGHAGGRCRSLDDPTVGRTIDNGNHLLLSGNTAVHEFLKRVGAGNGLAGPDRAEFPFLDLATGERWTVRPSSGRLPWWILCSGRRVPGTRPADYLRSLRLFRAAPDATVEECLGPSGEPLYDRFWEPLAVSVLNTEASAAAARLLRPVLLETFGRGEWACRPRLAREGLSACFIEPALEWLYKAGADVRFHQRLRGLDVEDGRVAALHFVDGSLVRLAPEDAVILAVPPAVALTLLPGLEAPQASRAILNAHFRLEMAAPQPSFLGLLGGLSQWLFVRDDVASVTVSAADAACRVPADTLALQLWGEVCSALGLQAQGLPPHRIIKEKRATFAQTPAEIARRPRARTAFANLFLAGDWTDTGLPATLEGSVRSGNSAAAEAQAWRAAA